MRTISPSPALILQPRPSVCLLRWTSLLYVAASVAIWVVDLDATLKALLAAGLGISVFYGWRCAFPGPARYRLIWHAAGHWTIQPAHSTPLVCDNWVATWIDPRIVLIRFRLGRWRRLNIALCADSLSPDTHRRLRARLLNDGS